MIGGYKKLDYFALTILVLKIYHRALARQMDEYVPQMIPAIRGSANSLIDVTPST